MENIVNKAVKATLNIIKGNKKEKPFSKNYMTIYLFTTENLKGVVDALNVRGKKILTVSASGDHIFNMLFKGAESIECYDVNYLAKYYYYFKESAILTLEYNEFIEFFFGKPFSFRKKPFDDKMLKKIIKNIRNDEAKEYWENLLNEVSGRELYTSALFDISHSKNTYISCNDYLKDETSYDILRKRLKHYKYKFYHVDIFGDLTNLPNKLYDIIYLSNILDRIKAESELESARKIKSIIETLKHYLLPNGLLGVCYLYCYQDDYWATKDQIGITNPDFRLKYFNEGFSYTYFKGINNLKSAMAKDLDALMTARKK